MYSFALPVDIWNRGVDHCGGRAISRALAGAERSTQATIMARIYDKLRRAELQRNTWRFSIREVIIRPIASTTMLLVPAVWVQSTTYFVGSIVADGDGTLWVSQVPDNLGNDPTTSPAWAEYFGPMTVSLWDTTGKTAYYAGELVYTAVGDGTNRTYVSMINANADNPATATAWDATVTYYKDQIVTRSAVAYMSRIDLNINQDPATTFFAEWSSVTTYGAAQKVTGSDGVIYQSIAGGNLNHDPTLDFAHAFWTNTGVLSPWDTTFVSGAGSLNWRQIGGTEFPMGVTLSTLNVAYPLGLGPTVQSTARNVFRLPAGFLRIAEQDPKAGAISYLGVPGNRMQDDWLFQGQYLVSSSTQALHVRFIADMTDVTQFDAMFCEGLGARMGLEACEPLTQSTAKLKDIQGMYKVFMFEARNNNAILLGSADDRLDDYIACRL